MTVFAFHRPARSRDAGPRAAGPALLLCCRRHVDLCRVTSAVCRRAPR